jgi:hypothetical protein
MNMKNNKRFSDQCSVRALGPAMSQLKWSRVSAFTLANAIFQVVRGNTNLLEEDHILESSIWQRIGEIVLKGKCLKKDRFWLRASWSRNTENVRVIIHLHI